MSPTGKSRKGYKAVKNRKYVIRHYKVCPGKSLTDPVTRRHTEHVIHLPKDVINLKWAPDTVFLPTKDNHVVVLNLTKAQIDAIPKDKYAVVVAGPAHLYSPTGAVTPGSGDELYTTFVMHLKNLDKHSSAILTLIRKFERDNGGDDPTKDIFLTPIDKNKMADCIMHVVLDLFGDKDKITLHGHELKLSEFFVLTHYYFLRINVLKIKARKPFCEYLEKKVFQKKLDFTVKTFNNYAADYENENFTDTKALPINFKYHAHERERPLQKVFHEIGWNFHNSPYFEDLREMKKNAAQFLISLNINRLHTNISTEVPTRGLIFFPNEDRVFSNHILCTENSTTFAANTYSKSSSN